MLLAAALLALAGRSFGQEEFKPSGSPNAKIFFNYHTDPDGENTGFEIQRAYFGYEHQMSEHFSAGVLLDVGAPETVIGDSVTAPGTLQLTAFLKAASLNFKKDRFEARIGMILLKQFKIQEKLWGLRYIEKSFQDLYGLGTSADLGVSAAYRFSDLFSADLTIRNGEGYKKLQADNKFNTGLGITLTPFEGWTIRGFYDYLNKQTAQYTVAHFIGYQNEKLSAGIEYNNQINHKNMKGRDLNGYSAYARYAISTQFHVFGRYDNLYSGADPETDRDWNVEDDGQLIITGVEYTPIKAVNMALNYRRWSPGAEAFDVGHAFYVNFQYAF